jgi:PDDEXK-like domain of unknown function (DUF3799)
VINASLLKEGLFKRGALPFDYDEIPAVNQSKLKPIGVSPLHCQYALKDGEGKPEKPYMRLGSVAHTATLEPHRLDLDFVPYVPPPGKTDRFASNAYDTFCKQHAPRKVIKAAERAEAVRIAAEVRRNKLAQRYLNRGLAELILLWREEKFGGVWCKARIDWLSESVADVMCELKTSNSISPRVFGARFANYGYDVQAAFYERGYRKITGRTLHAKCIAVESAEPHDVIVFDLAEAIDVGGEYVEEYLARFHACMQSGEWPGQYPETEVSLQLPQWRKPGEEDGLEELDLIMPEEASP